MIRFIGKRILQMIPVVLLVATLIFGILYLVPGDPAQIMPVSYTHLRAHET